MKFFRMFGRSIRDAFKSVFRNFSLSLASISCITITLVIVALSIVASKNVENFTSDIERDMTIVAFVKAETEDVEAVQKEIEKMDNIDTVKHFTKMENVDRLESEDGSIEGIKEQWNEESNPLLDSFEIKVKNVEKISEVAERIRALDEIQATMYGKGMVEKMLSAFDTIRKGSYVVVLALVLVTVFLIINTIKLTIFSRKREISIMRLVGASNISIKTPFIIEGMVLGLLGSIIPILAIIFGYSAAYEQLKGILFTPIINLIAPEPFIYMASLATLAIGIIVGMIGSASAVRKYLKV